MNKELKIILYTTPILSFSKVCSICLIFLLLLFSCTERSNIKPVRLTCENRVNPPVIDAATPRLSWINEVISDNIRGACQHAYRICIASTKDKLLRGEADIWDSDKVTSSDSYLIPYAGAKLLSGKDYWWRVQVWDNRDIASPWSAPACWSMGLLSPDEWQAKWIGAPWRSEAPMKVISHLSAEFLNRQVHDGFPHFPAPLFRKSFQIKDHVVSAKAFVTGLGFFEFYLNGQKIGDDCLCPSISNYTVRDDIQHDQLLLSIANNFRGYRVMYLSYDITDKLQKKKNVAGLILGDGFYDCTSRWVASFGSPRLLCQIEITYKDGSKDLICSDDTWKVKASPIVRNGIFDGEIYDANLETEEWASVSCDDTGWENAVIRHAPTGVLTAHTAPTDKVVGRLKPVSFVKNEDGTYAVDFGVEISGWIRFNHIQGKKGDTLQVKYIYESPVQPGVQKYIFKGNESVSYAPRFTWFAFRKAVISGIDYLTADMLTAEVAHTDIPVTAEFKSSNPLFDTIQSIWERCVLDNTHGCVLGLDAHRERCPYTGDGQVLCVPTMHCFDAAAFYEKWIRDIRDAQNVETGYVPNGAPYQSGCGGGVPWGAAMNIMPWAYYLHYGDIKILKDNYFAMKEQVRYMLTWLTKEGTMFMQKTNLHADTPNYWLNLGEWMSPNGKLNDELVHTFYLWRCADFTAKAAQVLNQQTDMLYYSTIANEVKASFHRKFYDTENKTYGDHGSNVFALVMGVPQERYHEVINTWFREITEKNNGHLNTGIFGTQFFFETLAKHGMNDVAYEAMNKRDFPSFGHWIEQGATVMWEQFDGKGSRNHPMFGGGFTWFYRTLAGVHTDEKEPGFKHIIISPVLPKKMDNVFYSILTPYGKVVSEVKRDDKNQLTMNVTIPVGSHATVYIPVSTHSVVTESGKNIEDVAVIDCSGVEDGRLIVKIKQGRYHFVVQERVINSNK